MNILIIEDEKALAEALAHILQKKGHVTDTVSDNRRRLIISAPTNLI